jgi:hypothetical protein
MKIYFSRIFKRQRLTGWLIGCEAHLYGLDISRLYEEFLI